MNRKRLIAGIIVLVVLVTAVVVVWSLRNGGAGKGFMASGTVEATGADLGFQAAGRVDSIAVHEGDAVMLDQELAWLDRADLLARQAAAEAQLAAARANLTELERGTRPEELAQGRAAFAAAEQRLADARRDLERTRKLEAGGAVSKEALDKAQLAFDVAQSGHDQAREQLRLLEKGPRVERIEAARAAVKQMEAVVQQVGVALHNAVVRAPFPGVVTVRHREPGETVTPGAPILTVINPQDRWVRIYVPENEVGRLSLGQQAVVTADAYPDKRYDGKVIFIASEAEFTPRNVQTTEERAKLVYAVKVAITGDPDLNLKPGLPADVHLQVSPR